MKNQTDAIDKLDPNLATVSLRDDLRWYDSRHLTLEGKGFAEVPGPYDRLPVRAEGVVPEAVWSISGLSAGLCLHFVTDADRIGARWTLKRENLSMDHMAATGVSGLALYTRTAEGGWRWLGVGRPTRFPTNEVELVGGLPEGTREYLLYLPLYNGVTDLNLGLPPSAMLGRAPMRLHRPVVFYGTSIVQGGCASRPGMAYPAILGRCFDVPTINLGFSGNGKMEPEVGAFVAAIDASVFVLDCLPNVGAAQVSERTEPLVRLLRTAHPETPIILVENITYQNAYLLAARNTRSVDSNRAYRKAYENLVADGVDRLYYVPGEALLGDDGEATVDGTHATDVGFLRMAEVLRPVLARALKATSSTTSYGMTV
jgi:hypothetical protein